MKEPENKLVIFKPTNTIVKVPIGTTLAAALEKADISMSMICGGKGKCGKCKVKIINKQIPYNQIEEKALTSKDMNNNIHLACQIIVENDLEVETQHIEITEQIEYLGYNIATDFEIDEHLKKQYIQFELPHINKPIDDLLNINTVISPDQKDKRLEISLSLLQNLSSFLRKNNYKVTFTTIGNKLLNLESGDTTERRFGLAFDLGTTTIAGILIDLKTGKDIAAYSRTNPQYIHGADVITRVNYSANEPGGLSKLQNIVIQAINEIIEELTTKSGVNYREIYEMSLAGNTIMNHIFLGVNPQYIGEAPYIPTFRISPEYTASELGLTLFPNAPVITLPNISGYVGGDITSFILAFGLHQREKITLSIDIGTNGEIVLGSKNRLVCCSAAAGPAFEGGQINSGMRATIGAIEKVTFDDDNLFYQVNGGVEPKGICGTGLIDLVASMLEAGILNFNGNIGKPAEYEGKWFQSRIIDDDNGLVFVVVPADQVANKEAIIINQKDIRELQLAKAAISAGIKVLMNELSIIEQDIDEVFIAGAFGTYINKFNAQAIGLIPKIISPDRIHFVGNASLSGAKKYLLSHKARADALDVINFARYVELSTREDFQKEFIESILFNN